MASWKTPSTSSFSSGSSPCSSRSSLNVGHGVDGDNQVAGLQTEHVDWKERCHTLEASLHKFKQQATRIRELLSEKMRDLEKRTQAAEERAEAAETKQKQVKDQLKLSNWQPNETDKRIHLLEQDCQAKAKHIQQLQETLDEQKYVRMKDAKKIEEKSCRIKDWVAKKVKDLECENSQLKHDNYTLSQQVETLRTRLQLLPVSAAREIHRLSVQDTDEDDGKIISQVSSSTNNSTAPPVPKRPSSSLLQTFRMDQQLYQQQLALIPHEIQNSQYKARINQDISPDSDENMALNEEFEPDYQEVDDNRQSKYEPKSKVGIIALAPPQVRIERRAFPRYRSSIRSSVGGPDDIFLDDCSPDSGKSPPLFKTLPKDLHLNKKQSHKEQTALLSEKIKTVAESLQKGNKGHHNKLQNVHRNKDGVRKKVLSQNRDIPEYDEPPPPSPKSKGDKEFKDKPSTTTSNSSNTCATNKSTQHTINVQADIENCNTVIEQYKRLGSSYEEPAYASPPTSLVFDYTSLPYNNRNIPAFATMPRRKKNPLEQYSSESSSTASRGYNETTHSALLSRSFSERKPKPPTPPLRRMPSWENRIYAIANVGLQMPDCGIPGKRHSEVIVTEGLYAQHIYKDLAVPVYTTLKGKATRIRSIPFTGESSSESDDSCSQSSITGGLGLNSGSEDGAVVSVAGPSSSGKSGNGIRVRKHVNHSSSGAIKRGVSSHSITSESSSDYAVPPDEVESVPYDSSGDSEPEHKLLKYTTTSSARDNLERCGYLTKLGGKVKNWRRRWAVLKGADLLYYKSPNEVARKPQGYINLDSHSRVVKSDGANTFQIITVKKTYYLTAESAEDMDQWIRVIQNVLKKQAADQVFSQTKAQESVKGWIIKTRHGRSRRCYTMVIGKYLMYYKTLDDNTPLGQIGLQGAKVEEVDRSCDSETDSDDTTLPDYTLAIKPPGQDPTYLMIPTKHEKDSWLYHLTVACGGNCSSVGTDYEQLVNKLMEVDGNPSCVYWKHPTLLHNKELLTRPLTTLPSEGLQIRALELFKSCQLFLNMAIESNQIDYHVTLAQNILNTCLQIKELQNELYCQLIKQTSPHPLQQKSAVQNLLCGSQSWFLCSDNSPTSPENSVVDLLDSKLNPSSLVFLQGWQLLAMTVSLFLPSQSVLWYLKTHLQKHADPRNEIGKYVVFCQRAIERSKSCGPREARPSRMEVLSILLRNPFHHSQPISIPVHFFSGTYQVVSFDGSTTVDEFLQSLNKTLSMRDCRLSGFALFTDDPAGQKLEHCLRGHLKICDVISKWEQAFLYHATQRSGKVDLNHTVRFAYKNRLYFKSQIRNETEKERLLLSYQISSELVEGRFPLNRELAVELAALMAQIEYGDLRGPTDSLRISSPKKIHNKDKDLPSWYTMQYIPTVLEKYYPKRYREGTPSKNKSLQQKLCDKWSALQGRSGQECVRIYLTVTRKWQFFGAKLFTAKVKYGDSGSDQVWLAVQEDSISVLEYAALKAISTFDYKEVVTFGGCRDDFMLVVNHKVENEENHVLECKTERLLFTMSKPKMLELTLLIANYINTRSQLPDLSQQLQSTITQSVSASPKYGVGRTPMYISSSIQV